MRHVTRVQDASLNELSALADIGKIMGGVVAALTLIGTVTEWWKKGPGRRRTWTKNFKLPAPGVRPAYVEALFGEPAFELTVPVLSITPGEGSRLSVTERVWPLATESYLTTWGSESDVVAYSLTTTSKRFKPKIRIGSSWYSNGPALNVRLGRTRLAQVSSALDLPHPEEIASWKGARRHEYYETYYFGNPGHYMTWMCGVSGTGYRAGEAGAMERLGPENSAFLRGDLIERLPVDQQQELDVYRTRAVVNSLMVQGMERLNICPEVPRSGPDYDVVRTLEKAPGVLGKIRIRRELRRVEGRPGAWEKVRHRLPRRLLRRARGPRPPLYKTSTAEPAGVGTVSPLGVRDCLRLAFEENAEGTHQTGARQEVGEWCYRRSHPLCDRAAVGE
ncbi:ETEC_3214 domain-containing protein [Streptomyces sp. NPDC006385]|uniref:ETEC_3214 domain-containing protein n=1 Tax=Streptomyces sp. NPDC006385 TaxID=3156761 RepID=UPI0033A68884